MKSAIIVSAEDPAGLNVKEKLLRLWEFKETGIFRGHPIYSFGDYALYTVDESIILAEDLPIEADAFIFLSKHVAKSGNSTFCVHPIGNWGEALGGRPGTLVKCMPGLMKKALNKLKELNNLGWEVTMEATHHGPHTQKSSVFIEIGSTEKQWSNNEAALIVAKVSMSLAEDLDGVETCVVVGGTHYNHVANEIMFEKDLAVGHVCPKHALEFLTKELLDNALKLSDATLVVLDWDGLASHKNKIRELTQGLNVKKSKEI